jgi:hypothetical protein
MSNSQKRSKEYWINRVNETGFEFLEFVGELDGRNSIITYKCPLGHITQRKLDIFLETKTCGVCSKIYKARRTSETRSVPLEDALIRLYESWGDDIIMTNYIRAKEDAHFECSICHCEWDVTASNVINGTTGCPNCARLRSGGTQKLNPNDVRMYIESDGCEWVSGEYKNAMSKLVIKFTCGHILPMSWASFRLGCRCRKCAYDIVFDNQRKPIDIIREKVESFGFTFIGLLDGYNNVKDDMQYSCPLGHITARSVSVFDKNPTCGECEKQRIHREHRGEKVGSWKGGISGINIAMRGELTEWNKRTAWECNYKCVICGEEMEVIHHLLGFNLIMQQALQETGLDIRPNITYYATEEILLLGDKMRELHEVYPGVALDKNCHNLFHHLYGRGDNTPEQFEDFKYRISIGEIQF